MTVLTMVLVVLALIVVRKSSAIVSSWLTRTTARRRIGSRG
jgi:hypothetical protein